ncbi:hypothetical protein GZH53_09895 [Flavihumibacter sp. R14]|nr:hypothetical protein [Flavihumibacter soli]
MEIILNRGRKRSDAFDLNFLAKEDNVYVMDNHLAAFWCWSKGLNPIESYNLFHIDRHNDLSKTHVKEAFHLYKNKKFCNMSIKKAVSLKVNGFQMLMWNNFIELYNVFNPGTFNYFEFVTPAKLPREYLGYGNTRLKAWIRKELTLNERCELENSETLSTVIDIDIDVFFAENGSGHREILTKKEFQAFVQKIKPFIKKAKLVTIALSPECCGGWENSINMFSHLNQELGLGFDNLEIKQ